MKRLTVTTVSFLIFFAFFPGCSKHAAKEPEKRILVVLTDGLPLKDVDVTYMEPGNDVVHIGLIPYIWQGEDTINCRLEKGLVYVNEKLVGADLSQIDAGKVPEPDKIIAVTGVTPENIRMLKRFPNLAVVEAWNIGDEEMAFFKDTPHLKGLFLPKNSIAYDGLACLKDMPNLRMLHMPKARIMDAGMVFFKDLKNLRELNLGSNSISDPGIANLAGLTNLRNLNLHFTYISDSGLVYLENLKNLRELNLMQTSLTLVAVKKLRKSLPGCRILFQE